MTKSADQRKIRQIRIVMFGLCLACALAWLASPASIEVPLVRPVQSLQEMRIRTDDADPAQPLRSQVNLVVWETMHQDGFVSVRQMRRVRFELHRQGVLSTGGHDWNRWANEVSSHEGWKLIELEGEPGSFVDHNSIRIDPLGTIARVCIVILGSILVVVLAARIRTSLHSR